MKRKIDLIQKLHEIDFNVFMSAWCVILDSITFALFSFTATSFFDISKRGIYVNEFLDI